MPDVDHLGGAAGHGDRAEHAAGAQIAVDRCLGGDDLEDPADAEGHLAERRRENHGGHRRRVDRLRHTCKDAVDVGDRRQPSLAMDDHVTGRVLETFTREGLEAGDLLQRHGDDAPRRRLADEIALERRIITGGQIRRTIRRGPRWHLRGVGDAARVEDQHDRPVAANRRAGIQPQRHEHSHDRFDDDVLADGDTIDDKAKLHLIAAEHDDGPARGMAGGAGHGTGLDPEQFTEEYQRQEPAAEAHHRCPFEPLDRHDRAIGAGAEGDQFADGRLWDRESVAPGGDDQRRDDRERERDPHPDGGP